jgi:UDP-N-acetylmuramyl pentapeptide synthase
MAEMASTLPASIAHHAVDAPDAAIDALRAMLRDGDRVFIKGSNGSGACHVAAAILAEFSMPDDANGGASHAA